MDKIDLTTFENLLRGNPGLVIGPGHTVNPHHCREIQDALKKEYSVDGPTLRSVCDSIMSIHGVNEETLRQSVAAFCKKSVPAPHLSQLAKVRWSSVLSASADIFLETAMQAEEEQRPTRKSVYTAYDLLQPLPSREVPIFKMIGTHVRNDFCLSTPSYLQRKTQWRIVVPTFIEKVAGNPVVCLGMSCVTDSEFLDIISEFIAGTSTAPSNLVFLADDPLIANQKIAGLLGNRVKLLIVNASLGQLTQCIANADKRHFPRQTSVAPAADDGFSHLLPFDDVATVVNLRVTPRLRTNEKLALKEMLFSPSVHEWDPYAYNMDFTRTLTKDTMSLFEKALSDSKGFNQAFVVTGNSASGKTTIMKRLAFEAVKLGSLVLWHKPTFVPDVGRRLRLFFDELSKNAATKKRTVFYFVDDPISAGSPLLNFVASVAESVRIRVFLVVGMRSSDWSTMGKYDMVNHFHDSTLIDIPDTLDAAEASALPQYLVDLEIAHTLEEANTTCRAVESRSTSDTLSLLYWLLPQTRLNITSSVQDEYFRLGDAAGFGRIFLADSKYSPQLLRNAYEMVAVAAHYEVPLPVEVLVSALGVDYTEWLNAEKQRGAAWGILYSAYSEDNSERYTTRNEIVTRVLVEAINGGSQLRSGELRVLKNLIRSCKGHTTPVYREFCMRLLVPHHRLEHLDYLEGLALYDLAIESLSHPDQSIVHHKGLWIKNKGRDATQATIILEQALQTPVYPYADRGEASEHIHNSLAATKLDAIEQGTLTWEQGKREAIEHLQKARALSFFSPKAVHVEARLATRIIGRAVAADFGDAFEVANRSLADIDRTLELVRSPIAIVHTASSSADALENVRQEVISALAHGRDIQRLAEEIWKTYQTQSGFIVAARTLLQDARSARRDKDYKKADDYCQTVRRIIEDAKLTVKPEVSEVQLHIVYEAYVVRRLLSAGHSSIDWLRIEQLATEASAGTDPARSPMIRFILAIARAHQGDWVSAQGHFTAIRTAHLGHEALWRPRALLLADQGGPRQVQGTIREVSIEKFLSIDELSLEVKCSRYGKWPKDGEIAHGYIEFAFAGPQATSRLT